MTQDSGAPNVPNTIAELIGWSHQCACGKTHSVELAAVSLREGAVGDIFAMLEQLGCGRKVTLVCDDVTRDLPNLDILGGLGKRGYDAVEFVLPSGSGGRPHADDHTVSLVERALEGADMALALGSGTVNDVVKLASFRRGIRYVCIGTAPSMNGYTSAIAAIMQRGVKRTISCHQPAGFVGDLDILANAPHELIAAGLGDLESKPTSTADFRLASLVRGDYYCDVPVSIVAPAEKRAASVAAGLARRDPKAIQVLTEALVLSGISMKVAGTSGPASGGEHLISHYWDMTAPAENRQEGWHGAQVGVATILSAALYGRLRDVDVNRIDVDRVVSTQPSLDEMKSRIAAHYGGNAKEVFEEYRFKHLGADAHRQRLEAIVGRWGELWKELGAHMRSSQKVREILVAANAPVTAAGLGLSRDHVERGLLRSREIRGRYTVLDFAAELGLLEQEGLKALEETGI